MALKNFSFFVIPRGFLTVQNEMVNKNILKNTALVPQKT